jgi:hypothetical protein
MAQQRRALDQIDDVVANGGAGAAIDIAVLFDAFPHETAIIMSRALVFGSVVSSFFVARNTYDVVNTQPWLPPFTWDQKLLLGMSIVRVAAFAVRIPIWFVMWRAYRDALCAGSARRISKALRDADSSCEFRFNRSAASLFNAWIAITLVIGYAAPTSDLGVRLRLLCLWHIAFILTFKLVIVVMFFNLRASDLNRGVDAARLEGATEATTFGELAALRNVEGATERARVLGGDAGSSTIAKECPICFAEFESSDEVRILRCPQRHYFHTACIDPWLLSQKNACPLCLTPVDVIDDDETPFGSEEEEAAAWEAGAAPPAAERPGGAAREAALVPAVEEDGDAVRDATLAAHADVDAGGVGAADGLRRRAPRQ